MVNSDFVLPCKSAMGEAIPIPAIHTKIQSCLQADLRSIDSKVSALVPDTLKGLVRFLLDYFTTVYFSTGFEDCVGRARVRLAFLFGGI